MDAEPTQRDRVGATTDVDTAACGPRVLCGWSPPALPADSGLKWWADRVLPRTGVPAMAYFAAVIVLLVIAPQLPLRWELAIDAFAALAAGSWCGLNFWRCRHAHCLVTGVGWLVLSGFAFVEAGLGHSVIQGNEQLVFLGVLVLALVFEGVWYLARGSNALAPVEGRSRS
jgi:hypothetical protein